MSEQVQNTTVITQKDLSRVIESVCQNIDAGTKIVTAMSSASVTINKILSKNDITKALTGLNKFKRNFDKYNLIIGSILETVTKPMKSTQFKSFADLLGETDDKDTAGKLTGKKRYTTIEAAQQIPNMVSGAFKALEAISAPTFAMGSARRIKKNMNVFMKTFDKTIVDMVVMFTQLNTKYDINKVLETLVKSPDVTISTVKNNINTKDGTDKTRTGTRTTTGKLGLLDGIAQMFTLFASLNQLQPPMKYKHFKKIIDNSERQIEYLLSGFITIANTHSNDLDALSKFTKELTGENGLDSLLMTIDSTVTGLIETFSKNNIKQINKIIGKPGDKNGSKLAIFSNIFNDINKYIVNDESLTKLSNEKIDMSRP